MVVSDMAKLYPILGDRIVGDENEFGGDELIYQGWLESTSFFLDKRIVVRGGKLYHFENSSMLYAPALEQFEHL